MDEGTRVATGPTSGDSPSRSRLPWLDEALSTIAEFRQASLGLVAWELDLPVEELAPAWHHARAQRLITPSVLDEETGEQMYEVTELGRSRPALA